MQFILGTSYIHRPRTVLSSVIRSLTGWKMDMFGVCSSRVVAERQGVSTLRDREELILILRISFKQL